MAYKISTAGFEGPFDLLLRLVEQQKVDIGTLSLSQIVAQFLAEIQTLDEMDLDVASDFVYVASTLASIKAALLTKSGEDLLTDEDDEFADLSASDVRDILVARLIAYKQFRNVALSLSHRFDAERKMHPRTAGPDGEYLHVVPNYLEHISLHMIGVTCADLLSRRESFLLEAEHVAPKRIPLETRVDELSRVIQIVRKTTLQDLLEGNDDPPEVVVAFLALLELFKRSEIDLEQKIAFGDIEITSCNPLVDQQKGQPVC